MTNGRGGARPGAGRKPYPQIKPGEIAIDVRDCRAYVSVWRREGGGFRLEPVQNWRDLEDAAIEHVESLGGYVTLSGIYPASDELIQAAN